MRAILGALLRAVGRLLRPVIRPDYADEMARWRGVEKLQRQVAKISAQVDLERREQHKAWGEVRDAHRNGMRSVAEALKAERQEARLTRERIEGVKTRLAHLEDVGLRHVEDRMTGLRQTVARHTDFSARVLRRQRPVPPHVVQTQQIVDRLKRIAARRGPVVVGPWTGEVGFELLYWAPFVRWALATADIDPARVTIVSRGGTRSWYDLPAAAYRDLFTLGTPDQFRAGAERIRKQRFLRGYERSVLRRLRAEPGLGAFSLIHPGMVYRVLGPYLRGEATMSHVFEHTHPRRLTAPPLPDALVLPESFVALRFYASDALPDTPGSRAFIASTIDALLRFHDVVLLNPGVRVDDHSDFAGAPHPRLHRIEAAATASENLALQTAVLSRASGFVGTYGGYAYLAPLLGVPAVAFYAQQNFYVHHLELARRTFADVGGASLVALDIAQTPLVASALGALAGRDAAPRVRP